VRVLLLGPVNSFGIVGLQFLFKLRRLGVMVLIQIEIRGDHCRRKQQRVGHHLRRNADASRFGRRRRHGRIEFPTDE
jgi:hypothetical protein